MSESRGAGWALGKGARATGDTRAPGRHSPLDCSSVTPRQVTSTHQDRGLNLEQPPSQGGAPKGSPRSPLPARFLPAMGPRTHGCLPAGLARHQGLTENFWKTCPPCNMKSRKNHPRLMPHDATHTFLLLTQLNWIHKGLLRALFTKSGIGHLHVRCTTWEIDKEVTE